jgi:hypothetical protein
MIKPVVVVLLLALAGCGGVPYQREPSPCAVSEASYACQIERYQNVNVN